MDYSNQRPPQDPRLAVPQPAEKTIRLGRAAFLGLTGVSGAALLLGKTGLPQVNFIPTVASVNGFTIYTVTSGYPTFDQQKYRLQIDGMVDRPLTMTLSDILKAP